MDLDLRRNTPKTRARQNVKKTQSIKQHQQMYNHILTIQPDEEEQQQGATISAPPRPSYGPMSVCFCPMACYSST